MKNYFLILLSSIFFLSLSCSSDYNDTIENNFTLPLRIGDYWIYNVNTENTLSRDSLFVQGEVVINNKSYMRFETKDNIATGFYSSVLRNNKLRKDNSKLLLTGEVSLASVQNLPINLDVSIGDFVIFDSNAQNNQALNSSPVTGIINQTFDNYPLTITYTLQSFGGETFSSYTSPDGSTFSNVKSTKIKLKIGVTTVQNSGGISIPIIILSPQDFVVSTLYLAEGIGVIYVNTNTTYTINPLVSSDLGIPSSSSQNQKEYVDSYNIN
jgi:hypothetical protein